MAKKVKITNFEDVLDNIKRMFNEAPKEEKSLWCESLNEMLDNMRDEDFFVLLSEIFDFSDVKK